MKIYIFRYCFTCFHISHKESTCPLLSDEEKKKTEKFGEGYTKSQKLIKGIIDQLKRDCLNQSKKSLSWLHPKAGRITESPIKTQEGRMCGHALNQQESTELVHLVENIPYNIGKKGSLIN